MRLAICRVECARALQGVLFSVSARALASGAMLSGISVCEGAREVCLRAKGQVAVLRLARGFSCSFVSGFTQGLQFQL
jgi:hypothetical protein